LRARLVAVAGRRSSHTIAEGDEAVIMRGLGIVVGRAGEGGSVLDGNAIMFFISVVVVCCFLFICCSVRGRRTRT